MKRVQLTVTLMASTSTFRGNARPIWQADADSEDEESETSVAFMNSGKVALLVVIDATPDMFRPWGDTNESAFRTALKVVCFFCCKSESTLSIYVMSMCSLTMRVLFSSVVYHVGDQKSFPTLETW